MNEALALILWLALIFTVGVNGLAAMWFQFTTIRRRERFAHEEEMLKLAVQEARHWADASWLDAVRYAERKAEFGPDAAEELEGRDPVFERGYGRRPVKRMR